MKSFIKKTKKINILLLNIVIIIVSFYFICSSEKCQEKFAPKKYWKSKAKIYETELKNDLLELKFLELDLEKENTLFLYDKEVARIKAEEKEDLDENYAQIEKEHMKKLNDIKEKIVSLIKEKELITNNLEIANNKIKSLR